MHWLIILLAVTACGEAGAPGGSDPQSSTRQPAGQPVPVNVEPLSQDAVPALDEALVEEGCIEAEPFQCALELSLVQRTNLLRAEAGLPPLVYDKRLARVARTWSVAQAEAGALGHEGFPEQREEVFAELFPGVTLPDIRSENCALSYSTSTSPAAAPLLAGSIVGLWNGSEEHRANMLTQEHKAVGIGIHRAGKVVYATQLIADTPSE